MNNEFIQQEKMIRNEFYRKLKWENSTRFVLKFLQCILSIYLIFLLYNIGPHWILIIASLVVPAYGKLINDFQ